MQYLDFGQTKVSHPTTVGLPGCICTEYSRGEVPVFAAAFLSLPLPLPRVLGTVVFLLLLGRVIMFVRTIHRASISIFLLEFLVTLFPSTLADEFTSPSNSEADLAVHYTLGDTVSIAWETSLSVISLSVSQWGGEAVGSLLSEFSQSPLALDLFLPASG